MRFKLWLENNEWDDLEPIDPVEVPPLPTFASQLEPQQTARRPRPDPNLYSQYRQVNFYKAGVGITESPIDGKMVMDSNSKIFIANERMHEYVCQDFQITWQGIRVRAYYQQRGPHTFWPVSDSKRDDLKFGKEALRILIGKGLVRKEEKVNWFRFSSITVADILRSSFEDVPDQAESEKDREARGIVAASQSDRIKKLAANRDSDPESWMYRYQEQINVRSFN